MWKFVRFDKYALSPRAKWVLENENIENFGDLSEFTECEAYAFRNMAMVTMEEIDEIFHSVTGFWLWRFSR